MTFTDSKSLYFSKKKFYKLGPLFHVSSIRGVIVGSNGNGTSNHFLYLIVHLKCLYFENFYLYSSMNPLN